MKIIFISIFLFTSIDSYSQEMDNWKEFKSDNFGFKVEFPKTPNESSHKVNSENGFIQMNILSVDCQKDRNSKNFVYLMNYSKYPDSFFIGYSKEDYDSFFDSLIQGMINGNTMGDARLQERKTLNLSGSQGREIKIIFNKGVAVTSARFILKGNNIFVMYVTTDVNKVPNADIHRFFNSFKFL